MQRRRFMGRLSVMLGALALEHQPIFAVLANDPWKIRMLTKEVGAYTEKGGTILFYLSEEGIVVVDAQFPEQAGHFIGELRKRVRRLFNTLINAHHHDDHSSGNIAFGGLVYRAIAHENSLANQQRVAKN